jgi:hypothetical protein
VSTAAILITLSFTAAFTIGTVTAAPAASSAAMLMPAIQAAGQLQPASVTTTAAVTAAAPSWTGRTCSAFSRWQAKPTTANLDRLVVFSLHLKHGYLAADVATLLEVSVLSKQDPGGVDVAAQYVGEDCWGGA